MTQALQTRLAPQRQSSTRRNSSVFTRCPTCSRLVACYPNASIDLPRQHLPPMNRKVLRALLVGASVLHPLSGRSERRTARDLASRRARSSHRALRDDPLLCHLLVAWKYMTSMVIRRPQSFRMTANIRRCRPGARHVMIMSKCALF